MKLTIRLILIWMAVLLMGCSGDSAKNGAQQGNVVAGGYDQTMHTADSLYNSMQFREAYTLYLQLLGNKEVKADSEKRLNVLNSLCMSSESSGHKAEQTKWLQQLLDLAKQEENAYYQSLALLTMGKRLYYEGDQQQGIKYVSDAIDMAEETDLKTTDHLIHSHLIVLAGLYDGMKDYANALKIDERNLQLTMEGTRWGDAPDQQFIDRRMALAKMALVLAKMGNLQRADSVYNAWKAVQYEGNHTRDYFIVDYLRKSGRYQETIPVYNQLIQQVREHGDTLGEIMNTAKWGLAWVYKKMGNYQQATELYSQVVDIQDTLKNRKARKNAQELAAAYHAQEQELALEHEKSANTRNRLIIIIVLAVLLGVAVYTYTVVRQKRIINLKNQSLVAQISEAMKYKDLYKEEMAKRNTAPNDISDLNTLTDEQLFQYVNDVVVRERLFLDSRFDRQTIMDRFQLSKERVGAIFAKGSQYAKLTDYTQELRLEYSTMLLTNNPDKSISQVADESGFGSYSYYCKCFRQRFGMTPSEFRMSSI